MLGLETKPFDYEEYFTKMIRKKKESHTYWVFRKVNRKADDFPKAHDYTHQDKPKDITIWCSNDCLGMSPHETVKNAAKYFIIVIFITNELTKLTIIKDLEFESGQEFSIYRILIFVLFYNMPTQNFKGVRNASF